MLKLQTSKNRPFFLTHIVYNSGRMVSEIAEKPSVSLLQHRTVAQLSQRNRTAGWVSFRWLVGDGVGQTILCTKRCRCQKTNSIDVLHDKSTFIRKTVTAVLSPSLGRGLRGNVRCSSYAHWKARSGLIISHN